MARTDLLALFGICVLTKAIPTARDPEVSKFPEQRMSLG